MKNIPLSNVINYDETNIAQDPGSNWLLQKEDGAGERGKYITLCCLQE